MHRESSFQGFSSLVLSWWVMWNLELIFTFIRLAGCQQSIYECLLTTPRCLTFHCPHLLSSPGKMSSDRALRKQQQLNNLVYVVTNQAKPGDRIVDFCSGGVLHPSFCSRQPFPNYVTLLYYIQSHVFIWQDCCLRMRKKPQGPKLTCFFFCLFQGHVGIVLAHMLPSCQVKSE